jgi:HEAT repeat protein
MATHRSSILLLLAIASVFVASAGCNSFLGYRGWPFPEHDRTTFLTPAMRIDTIKQFAGQSTGVDSPEQRQLTDQLARQIQIESDPLVRKTIVDTVAQFRTPLAMQIIQAGLNDGNADVRLACCTALGNRGETTCVPNLATVLRDDEDTDVRIAAAEALGKFKTDEAKLALVVALDDRDPAMQYVGMQSMKTITGKDYGGDVQAWRLVATGGTPANPPAPSIAERIRSVTPF